MNGISSTNLHVGGNNQDDTLLEVMVEVLIVAAIPHKLDV